MLKKAQDFVKKFWGLILGAGAFVLYLVLRKKTTNDTSTAVRSAGDNFADNSQAARDRERQRADAEAERHRRATEEIVQKYKNEREKLNVEVQAEADQIVKKYGMQPVKLAEELSKVTGFKIIMPKD